MALNILFLFLMACTSGSLNENSDFKEKHEVQLKDYLVGKLKYYNDNYDSTKEFDIWTNSILKKDNDVGVYNFGRVGSHISKKNFFTFNGSEIVIIKSNKEESILDTVRTFLQLYQFSEHEISNCNQEIKKILSEPSGDSF